MMLKKLFHLTLFILLLTSIIHPVFGDRDTVFGPTQYTRANGKPVTETSTFPSALTGSDFTLIIHNGDSQGDYRVSSGTIILNGVQVAGPSDFNQQVEWIERNVNINSSNALSVTLGGNPGSFITITISSAGSVTSVSISATPDTIQVGQSATLSWSSTNADSVSIDQGIGNVALSGSITVSPTQTTTYTISATGPGGTATDSVTVTVNPIPSPTVSISASPTFIQVGESATLTWTSSNADSATIDNGIGSVALSGSTIVSPSQTTTYTITVTGPGGTATASVTVTVNIPSPTVTISALPTTIEVGESSTLTWTSTNADSATIDNGIGSVALSGSTIVSPSQNTTYTITVTGPGGTATASVTVTVNISSPTVTISALPTTIEAGESSTLTWTSANADSATIDQGIGDVALNGSMSVSPIQTTVYTITVTGAGGTASAMVNINVNNSNPNPTVTISASPEEIEPGGSATLTWTSTNADSATIDNGIGSVSLNGSTTVSPIETTLYTITVSGPGGTAEASATVTVNQSGPSVEISAFPESVMTGQSTTLIWESTNADSASIDNEIGSVSVSGSISVTPTAETIYTITATGPGGTASDSITITMSPINLSITSPSNGATITKPYVNVEGNINNPSGRETAVIVNGIPAIIDSNHFFVQHVPLAEGENTIIVSATDVDGFTAGVKISVNCQLDEDYIIMTADPETGVSPLITTLKFDGSFNFATPPIGFSGPGQVEIIETTEDGYRVKMTAEGIYEFNTQVTDDEGNVYTDSVKVKVISQTALDTLLRAKWNGMKQAMLNGDAETAASYFTFKTGQKYYDIFTALSDQLTDIAQAMSEIEPVYFPANGAKYLIQRVEEVQGTDYIITYFVYFIVDQDGIWRILRF